VQHAIPRLGGGDEVDGAIGVDVAGPFRCLHDAGDDAIVVNLPKIRKALPVRNVDACTHRDISACSIRLSTVSHVSNRADKFAVAGIDRAAHPPVTSFLWSPPWAVGASGDQITNTGAEYQA
jgi:hypothetical protein